MVLLSGCAKEPTHESTPPAEPKIVGAEIDAEAEPEAAVIKKAAPREPNPYVAPLVRTAGDLTVHAPPQTIERSFAGRLRSHIDGGLSKGSPRIWVGPQVPGFVALLEGTTELFLLDRVGDEFMAFYRDPYDSSSCSLGADTNCHYFARLYDIEGNELWTIALHELFSAPRYFEIQDIRYADGFLYFNEACQSYSSGAKGKCSSLVAVDPKTTEVRWRTRPLVSNGRFLVHGEYIVSGYGFTNEKDFIFVVSRDTGSILHKVKLRKSAETFEIAEDGLLEVVVYPGTLRLFEMRNWDSDKPKLVKTTRETKAGRITTGRR